VSSPSAHVMEMLPATPGVPETTKQTSRSKRHAITSTHVSPRSLTQLMQGSCADSQQQNL
jgi:hypothetical protein